MDVKWRMSLTAVFNLFSPFMLWFAETGHVVIFADKPHAPCWQRCWVRALIYTHSNWSCSTTFTSSCHLMKPSTSTLLLMRRWGSPRSWPTYQTIILKRGRYDLLLKLEKSWLGFGQIKSPRCCQVPIFFILSRSSSTSKIKRDSQFTGKSDTCFMFNLSSLVSWPTTSSVTMRNQPFDWKIPLTWRKAWPSSNPSFQKSTHPFFQNKHGLFNTMIGLVCIFHISHFTFHIAWAWGFEIKKIEFGNHLNCEKTWLGAGQMGMNTG